MAELSGGKECHPRALRKPDMNLSTHQPPIVQPQPVRAASGQKAMANLLISAVPIAIAAGQLRFDIRISNLTVMERIEYCKSPLLALTHGCLIAEPRNI